MLLEIMGDKTKTKGRERKGKGKRERKRNYIMYKYIIFFVVMS